MMAKIIYLDPGLPHYRIDIYDYFKQRFDQIGHKFMVIYDISKMTTAEKFPFIRGVQYSFKDLVRIIKIEKPDIILSIIGLNYTFFFPFFLYARLHGIKNIFRAHGINLSRSKNLLSQLPYHIRNFIADAIILYSKNEVQYVIKSKDQIFVANNTLNYRHFIEVKEDKLTLKEKYGIPFKRAVLFCGRILPRKRLDILVDAFLYNKDKMSKYAMLIVGDGLSEAQKALIQSEPNIFYFGKVYDKLKLAEIFCISDVFCIPGSSGLSINHAFFYGLPYITTMCQHGPEICYVKSGINGYILSDSSPRKLGEILEDLLENDSDLTRMSMHAKETLFKEASIEGMFQGYLKAISMFVK